MRNLVLSIFLITSSVFAESCKKYESEIDSYLLCYKEVLYFFNESKIVNVTNYGDIDYHGHDVNDRGYGVRPAMGVELDEILNISSNNKCGGYGIHLLR